MSKNAPDLEPGPGRAPSTATRRQTAVRRPPTSARLAREARQQRLAYFGLFGVILLIVLVIAGGALWEYVVQPAQAVATVNGRAIRNDELKRYQGFETFLLQNQYSQLQAEISQLSQGKNAKANQTIVQQLQSQLSTVQANASNIQAYTLSQMEQSIELAQAAAKLKPSAAPTSAQIDAALAKLKTDVNKSNKNGYARILNTGINEQDLRNYYLTQQVVQDNVTKHFAAQVKRVQPQAKARHILVAASKKSLADNLATSIRKGADFAALAKKYSTDNGGPAPTTTKGETAQQKKQAEQQYQQSVRESSANNGGWLRDPTSGKFVANQPSWITPQTSFVKPVLDAILSMKPGEVRVVKSQFGWHVIQVTAHRDVKLSKKDYATQQQQQGQQGYQNWATTATDTSKNKVNPPDPYAQFPPPTTVQ